MKMKNAEIIQVLNGLDRMSDVELPVKIAYGIKKNIKKLMAEYQDYDDQRRTLVKKHNNDEKSKDYGKELRELLDIEVEVDIHKVPETIFDGASFEITLQQMTALDFMIE